MKGLKEITVVGLFQGKKEKIGGRGREREEINKQIMNNEETKWQGMNVFCSIITRISCFGEQKKKLAKLMKQLEARKEFLTRMVCAVITVLTVTGRGQQFARKCLSVRPTSVR